MSDSIGVLIVNYNSAALVMDLLDSLPDALTPLQSTTVVVDNGSTDGSLALLEGRDDIEVVREKNRGYAAGINAGARLLIDSDCLLILNPDCRLSPKSVPTMVRALRETGAGVIVPRLTSDEGRLQLSLRREPTLGRAIGLSFTGLAVFSETVAEPTSYATRTTTDWATGAVMLVDRGCFDELGGWDESFFLYSEETDFCLRAGSLGWATVFEPAATAIHLAGGSGRSSQTYTMQILNRLRLYSRRRNRAATSLYYLALAMRELMHSVRGSQEARHALLALALPSRRPPELNYSCALVPVSHPVFPRA